MQVYSVQPRVRWRRVALFYAIALGWAILVGAIFAAVGYGFVFAGRTLLSQMLVGLFYMPAPMVAALTVERIYKEKPLIRQTFVNLNIKTLWLALGALFGLLFLMYGLTWILSGDPGFPGVGRIHTDPTNIARLVGEFMGQPMDPNGPMANLWAVVGLTAIYSLVAGFTVNGVFGYGQEYGWRGWLANELRPLGTAYANIITGVMWGLWYTPLILLGYNYNPYNYIGPIFMVFFCIAMSFLLWRARKLSSSILAPGILLGIFNSFAMVFVLTIEDRNRLISAPFGLVGTAAAALLAAAFWFLPSSES
jgi:hypothetical protein